RAGADAEHGATVGQVVDEDDAVGDVEGVVVGDADDAGAEPDALGALAGGGDEDFGAGDGLPAAGVVLAYPGLVVAEVVEPGDDLEVALEREGGVLAGAVKGRHKDAKVHAFGGHGFLLL